MRTIIFITHSTLSEDHANMCFKALSNSKDPISFDKLIIYNSHQEEFPNEEVLSIYDLYNMEFIKEVEFFDYDPTTPKCLGGDMRVITDYCVSNFEDTDQVLLLKSDCMLSINFLNELKKLEGKSEFIFTAPLINGKRSSTNEDMFEYIKLPYPVLSSEDTFFMEDECGSQENHFRDRPGENPGNSHIKWISCTVKRDWSCHYVTVNLLPLIGKVNQDWGGCSFIHLKDKWIGAYKSFVLHKYHCIISENREVVRPGEWGEWLRS